MIKHLLVFLLYILLLSITISVKSTTASTAFIAPPAKEPFIGTDGMLACVDEEMVQSYSAFTRPFAATDAENCLRADTDGWTETDEGFMDVEEGDYLIYTAELYDIACTHGPDYVTDQGDGIDAAPLAFYTAGLPADEGTDEMAGYCKTPDHLFADPELDDPEIPIVVNSKVRWYIKYFQTDARYYFEKWLQRTGSFETLIKGVLKEEGLPEDLFYLALIESGLNPKARSRANAVGIWQFIKPTAKRYGLRVNWWIDERRDPEKATRAAATYLKSMYGRFGSWYLAAAGYNGGENRVKRAIQRHGSKDFWTLSRKKNAFKRETRGYVPKYLAAMMIAKDPEAFGFTVSEYGADFIYDMVNIPYATDLRVIARAAGVPVRDLRRLNPELLHWFTPPDYPDYAIKLPKGTAETFEANFRKVPPPERLRFHRHRIRPGETLSEIAQRYKTRVKLIVYLNDLKNPRFIRAGKTIIIPVRPKKGYARNEGRPKG